MNGEAKYDSSKRELSLEISDDEHEWTSIMTWDENLARYYRVRVVGAIPPPSIDLHRAAISTTPPAKAECEEHGVQEQVGICMACLQPVTLPAAPAGMRGQTAYFKMASEIEAAVAKLIGPAADGSRPQSVRVIMNILARTATQAVGSEGRTPEQEIIFEEGRLLGITEGMGAAATQSASETKK